MKIAFGFDLHNTILLSNDAWIDALSECSEEKYKTFIQHEVYSKTSRKMIAEQIGADYAEVLELYHSKVKPDTRWVYFLQSLREYYPLYLISASNWEKVYRDLKGWNGQQFFDGILTKESFDKRAKGDWDALLKKYSFDLLIYIGNDMDEDVICHPNVIPLLNGSFLKKLEKMELLKRRGDER